MRVGARVRVPVALVCLDDAARVRARARARGCLDDAARVRARTRARGCLDDAALVDAAALLDDVGAEDLGVGVREEVVPHLERGAVLVRGRGLGLRLLLLQSCALQSHLLQSD